jgi:voltage-gated potassium channel
LKIREKIYNVVHIYEGTNLSVIYKYFMIILIAMSIVPLTSKTDNDIFLVTDKICLVFFAADYILRWITADYKFKNHKAISFIKYPFRIISIIDFLSLFALTTSFLGPLENIRLAKMLAVFRVIRLFRYSKNVKTILDILKKSQKPLVAVGSLAVGYIFISAIIIFNVEPETFNSFFDALYWSTISLTTVGYGDIYPVTMTGRTIAMASSFLGIAIVALPAGIVTAEYINEIKKE